ncbi:M56 family metallopeptidase [Mongoliitalea daihaiensis]|uniref:M56 family metallopeptidase n=1 Tax=Mongoliitalea daihaiensis TaxID=2782006 RepID=UPI001F2F65C0|nr:M56 family metallopeptidase [Mongoliitalea daihaiensis]UJP63713.1 M56 family metallopeptidase [Mongoliitalea daihaiensis]
MITLLLKSTIALALLLALYQFFLIRERMFTFNRFYLVFSVFFALSLPFISLPSFIEQPSFEILSDEPVFSNALPEVTSDMLSEKTTEASHTEVAVTPISSESSIPWQSILWVVYGLGVVFFFSRFVWQLIQLRRMVRKGRLILQNGIKYVLLEEVELPFTFLSYLFINKEEYLTGRIEKAILDHELVHIRERHSWDIILLELVKIAYWFNPLIGLYKKSVQLNHEFLADAGVLRQPINKASYQYLLLQKVSIYASHQTLSSAFNFQVTKRRLLMMGKQTNKFRLVCLQTCSVLLAITLLFSLSSYKTVISSDSFGLDSDKVAQFEALLMKGSLEESPFVIGLHKLDLEQLRKIYWTLTPEEREKTSQFPFFEERVFEELLLLQQAYPQVETTLRFGMPPAKKEINQETYELWLQTKNVELTIDGQERSLDELKNYAPKDFSIFEVRETAPKKFLKKPVYSIKLMTHDFYQKKYFESPKNIQVIEAKYPNSDKASVRYFMRFLRSKTGVIEEYRPKNYEESIFYHLRTLNTADLDFNALGSSAMFITGESFSVEVFNYSQNKTKLLALPIVNQW